ncbi:hypothetical protein KQX54_016288 [Cotesia glomerata]|uniref:Uncharacterized protein n=1 Tax=Cotesia glomerata TaxID=32391 RepID=A0AAV7I6I5_COTGL|nr:hypothetical protein KQX54_016288 [Cotesia glomerata]
MILSVLILLTSQLFGVQGEIVVILKDIEYPFHDPEYITEPDAYINENNEIFCVYGNKNFTLSTSMYPDDFPLNQYKLVFEISNDGKPLLVSHVYYDSQ